jgi:DUF4097 and DUF4098 domain-containing protein YvlB
MRRYLPLLVLFAAQPVLADRSQNWNRVMGDIEVREGEQVGNVRSVNGDIELEDYSRAASVKTTNGRIRVGADVTAEDIATVNGNIRAGEALQVTHAVRTVNGSIRLKERSSVGDSVKTVNGSVELVGTQVGADVTTTNGDIELRDSIVDGDIIFEEVSYNSWNQSYPTLTIDADSKVNGTIYLRRKVNLRISDGAEVGEIKREYQ